MAPRGCYKPSIRWRNSAANQVLISCKTVQGGYPVDFATSTLAFSVAPDPDTNETVLSAQTSDGATNGIPDNTDVRGRVLFVNNTSGTVTVTDSTVSSNQATRQGGGIYNSNGTVTVTSSTISSNTTTSSTPGGGGIFNEVGTVTMLDSTLSANAANDDGA